MINTAAIRHQVSLEREEGEGRDMEGGILQNLYNDLPWTLGQAEGGRRAPRREEQQGV